MRRIHILLLLCLLLPWTTTHAGPFEDQSEGSDTDDFPPGILCDQCRDFYEHPMDAVALVYNGFFGDNPWLLDSAQGFPYRVYRLDRSSVLVWFEGVVFDMPTLLPNLMEVMVRLPNGLVLPFTVLQGGPDLPIGDPNRPSNSCTCVGSGGGGVGGGGGGGGDGGDDYEEPDDIGEIEIDDDRVGLVDIIDPDEDGDFPDWEEEV